MYHWLLQFLLVLLAFSTLRVSAMEIEDIRHLLDRTGFGVRPADVAAFVLLSREQSIDRLLDAEPTDRTLPDWADKRPFLDRKSLKTLPEAERKAKRREYNRQRRQWRVELKAWWYQRMLDGNAPLIERMTLFWHNHFTSELRKKVGSPQLMLGQHLLLRRHALGNFAELLRSIVIDPAMLIYLDGARNRKQQPNENFARELLELFTLGEGHYTEADIKNAARALSGWRLDRSNGIVRFNPRQHDDGQKHFLGRTGHFGTDAIIAILLEKPRTAEFIVEQLWREFVSPEPDPNEIKRLAKSFRESGYEIRPLMHQLLQSEAFWALENRGSLIKSPIELMIGTLYRFELPAPPERRLIAFSRQMGQDLFDPPDVRGWRGHTAWIDADRLLARERFIRRITRDLMDESARAGQVWTPLDEKVLAQLLWPMAGPEMESARDEKGVRAHLIAALLDPRYQLK